MATIHISEAEAALDFTGLLAQARAGDEVVIKKAASPDVVLRLAGEPYVRSLSESLRIARERGSKVTPDEDFAKDVKAAVDSHPEPLQNFWDEEWV